METIALKALEKERERRYQSAVELAQDIRRYLAGEAIVGRPPSIVYQLRIFARRHKALFAALIGDIRRAGSGLDRQHRNVSPGRAGPGGYGP